MKVLVIDDEIVNLELLNEYLKEEGYEIFLATNGLEGFSCLKSNKDIALILLDRSMPVMDGIEFLQQLKNDAEFSNIPVVMQTAVADNDSIVEGINAGAYYYLTKPYKRNVLISIINSAINDSKYKKSIVDEMQKNRKMLGLLNSAWFELQTMSEAQNLAYFIAASFPDPDKVVLGLSEVLLNAIEHGNLGINYKEKGKLMMEGRLHEEIARLESLPENKVKKVQLMFEKNTSEVKVTIKDEGQGFNWKDFIEMHPDRATDPNGRGIMMAMMISFDSVEYKGKGNEVCCTVKLK